MAAEIVKQSWPVYLRQQADRCQQLSRNCMDLGAARELRLMADEYCFEATKLEAGISALNVR